MEATTTTDETMSALPSAVTELLDPTSDKRAGNPRRQDDDVAMVLTGAVGSAELLRGHSFGGRRRPCADSLPPDPGEGLGGACG